MSALELEKVPLPMMARRDRLFSLRMLACITIIALILKGSMTMYMSNKSMATDTVKSLFFVFFYFFFCEILPICIILVFYKVDSWNRGNSRVHGDDANYNTLESNATDYSARSPRTVSPMRSSTETQPEVVDAIIARLSQESGTFDECSNTNDISEKEQFERESLLNAKGSSRYQNLSL